MIVALADGRELRLGRAVAGTASLTAGMVLDDDAIDALLAADRRSAAWDTAFRLLARRSRSRVEMERALHDRGYENPLVAELLVALEDGGLLDDEAFAETFVRDRIRLRPRGRAGLLSELRARGVHEATAERAVARVFADEELDDGTLARAAARSWWTRTSPALRTACGAGERFARRTAGRRLAAFLARRGFPADLVRGLAMELIRNGAPEEDEVHGATSSRTR